MKKTLEEHASRFDEKAAEYDDSKSAEYRACANLVIEHAAPGPADVVLDLGTGTGAIALALAPDAKRVIGRDISEGMLERAREKVDEQGGSNVEFGEGRFREPNVDPEDEIDAESAKPPRAHTRSVCSRARSARSHGQRDRRSRATRVDLVTSNFAMHHLADEEKREAIDVIAGLEPRRVVLGDVMFFGEPDPSAPFYSPAVDDPATVGVLADALTDAGFSLTAVERVHEQVGVLVAERATP